jgi:hypothetical protein
MITATNMVFELVDGIHVVVHSAQNPSDGEWAAYTTELRDCERVDGLFVFTHGGAPNARQRKLLREVWAHRGKTPRVSVLTNAIVVRTVVTAFNIFLNNQLKMFALSELHPALEYLGIPPERRDPILRALERLRARLGA